ncbi:FIST signal transduction protein [Chryseobacterium salviniae]|uniref:FIST N-terminal domain-containing protein n=1 Tax=Chryseobacterium salviniae TaxID=3101750 RepID=A0ABU6HSK1_9FLAO|nr:FIST N-terminal domain-containing protein [Chryseobacterium sp. T9W2-O]MEC3875442.1 FIST N-terminal domain-containing protein [Chryseobacterium sp. T9W2-O]
MKVAELLYKNREWKLERNDENLNYENAQLVLAYGVRNSIEDKIFFSLLKEKFPNAEIALSSSSGEIYSNDVYDDTVAVTILSFETACLKTAQIDITDFPDSYEAGKLLINQLPKEDLKWVFILSDGSSVNGSQLVEGLNSGRPEGVLITGGLAGDGDHFEKTVVGLNAAAEPNKIVAIGFYGNNLMLSHSSFGGWESFGLEKTVTKSHNNVLYEIDGKNALELYKKYLGKYAQELPGSALLFPLSLTSGDHPYPVVRTILSVNENDSTMVFAGDLPEGSKVRFMKANIDRLVDAAHDAANQCLEICRQNPKMAIIISCVGRKLVLGDRTAEEVDMVKDVLGPDTLIAGFYSYGEISPLRPFDNCVLHNQTITITTINEIAQNGN